jgi:hypothetical protein
LCSINVHGGTLSPKPQTRRSVTVEDSFENINNVINELEEDDPPAEAQTSQPDDVAIQQAIILKESSYTH